MSSDTTNTTVVAIQGNPVNSETLGASEDGYVLTWDNTDGYIVARPVVSSGLRQAYFTSSGTWTCPTGVTNVILVGCGGGGGGGGAGDGAGGAGGGGALQQTSYAAVTPGNNYTVTIGSGGSGGAGSSSVISRGNDGSPTIFGALFSAIGAGGAGFQSNNPGGGLNYATGLTIQSAYYDDNAYSNIVNPGPGYGGFNAALGDKINGQPNLIGGFAGGTTNISSEGGGGGGAGPQGAGGNGAASGANGPSGGANTGAGGAGGGGSVSGGGSGGNGGSGYLYIIY